MTKSGAPATPNMERIAIFFVAGIRGMLHSGSTNTVKGEKRFAMPVDQQLLYVADPMCSWCWGFHPVITAIQAEFSNSFAPVLIMGGLRPWTKQALSDADRAKLLEHWGHVAKASGQPFTTELIARSGFVYDSEPAARAVVTAQSLYPGQGFAFLGAVQAAFYAQARDVTDESVLADIAQELGHDRTNFAAMLVSLEARQETIRHFQSALRMGVRGFPTVIAVDNDKSGEAICIGYAPLAEMRARLEAYLAKAGAA